MNKITLTLLGILLLSGFAAFAQLEDGTSSFSNEKITLKLVISDGGETIKSATVEKDGKSYSGSGVFRRAQGSEWYEFQTNACNYSFDVPEGSLVLEEFDCKSGQKSNTYTLNALLGEMFPVWEGKYVNGHGAVLVIDNISALGFDYKLNYKGLDECEGLVLSGTLDFDSPTKASGAKDFEYPVKVSLTGNKLTFDPPCCDGDLDMDCLRFFETEFIRK